ncbi:MAG: leucine-rich repeat domain-containing protein [Chlamydiia bacterium]
MPCKSTTKLGNLPDDLQSFEISTTPFMNRRWKVLSKEVEELWSILKRFRAIIGFDPFEHLIVKIHHIYGFYSPLLEKKESEKKFLAEQRPEGYFPKIEPVLREVQIKPKAILSKHSIKFKMMKLEEENLLILFHHFVDIGIFKASFGITPAEIRHLLQEHTQEFLKYKKLNLSKLKLTHIPKEILLFKHIKCLNISQNQLEFLPEWIGELEDLETINISKNRLYNLPASFYKLKKLKTIFIHSNRLTHVPLRLSHLPLLKRLVS